MESILENRGLTVEETDLDDGELSMTLQLSSEDEDTWLVDLATVLGAYYGGLQSQGWGAGIEQLVARFTDPAASPGSASESVQVVVQTEWAKAYDVGDLSMGDFLSRAKETTKLVDADGEVHDVEDVLQEDSE